MGGIQRRAFGAWEIRRVTWSALSAARCGYLTFAVQMHDRPRRFVDAITPGSRAGSVRRHRSITGCGRSTDCCARSFLVRRARWLDRRDSLRGFSVGHPTPRFAPRPGCRTSVVDPLVATGGQRTLVSLGDLRPPKHRLPRLTELARVGNEREGRCRSIYRGSATRPKHGPS
jgi:hypothetical protein